MKQLIAVLIIVIFMLGIVIGQNCKANTTDVAITRKDLFMAAALCGLLANDNHTPTLHTGLRLNDAKTAQYIPVAIEYAEAMAHQITE